MPNDLTIADVQQMINTQEDAFDKLTNQIGVTNAK